MQCFLNGNNLSLGWNLSKFKDFNLTNAISLINRLTALITTSLTDKWWNFATDMWVLWQPQGSHSRANQRTGVSCRSTVIELCVWEGGLMVSFIFLDLGVCFSCHTQTHADGFFYPTSPAVFFPFCENDGLRKDKYLNWKTMELTVYWWEKRRAGSSVS